MENKNKHILHYVIGIIIGIALTHVFFALHSPRDKGVSHRMTDGTMMSNGMDMTSMMASMNASLQGKKGDEFDEAFIDEMIVHHQGAIDMAELALTNAKHQEIKDLADAIISAQTREINQMKQWKSVWFK